MFEHVMIGVDGHEGGRDAIALARKLVAGGGELTLAHVYSGDPRIYHPAGTSYRAAEPARSLTLLDQAREDAQIDAAVRYIEAASVGQGLHELADREGADLLVLGSCRRGLLGRVVVGDQTCGALHGACCAVAVAPAGYRRGHGAIREVGVGFDGSPESTVALEEARRLAHDLGATLSALEVTGRRSARAPRRPPIVDTIAYGEPADELARYSASLDLLVVGSRGYRAIGRLIHGSTSSRLAGSARCPLLVVPHGDRSEQTITAGRRTIRS
jgi:nucleotide-binding universal stress UspA family protein